MDMHLPYHYDSAGFVGREDIVTYIIDMLYGYRDNPLKSRGFLVDGPSKRGKTWLMRRIEESLHSDGKALKVVVCLFEGRDFTGAQSLSEDLTCDLLSRLFIVAHNHISELLPLFGITDEDTLEERYEKIRSKYQYFGTARLLAEIRSNIKEPTLFIIIVDGIDEIHVDVLSSFEKEFIVPLFRNNQVRLLASRRIDSLEHRWREHVVRIRLSEPFILEQFVQKEYQPQIEQLITQKDLNISFEDLCNQMKGFYSWGNPGANAFIVEKMAYNDNNKQMNTDQTTLISKEDIRDCLIYLMSSPRDPTMIDDLSFERVGQMIMRFPKIAAVGAPRHLLNDLFGGVTDQARDAFLRQLQDRGIGYFDTSGNYIIHADFVELFRELHARTEP
jgi:hypothetical protein